MSAGPPRRAEGQDAGGPVPQRAQILSQLEAERRQAEGCYAWDRERELRAQIGQLSAGTPANPSTETTGRRAARKQRTQ